jgi:hypothetical protein
MIKQVHVSLQPIGKQRRFFAIDGAQSKLTLR